MPTRINEFDVSIAAYWAIRNYYLIDEKVIALDHAARSLFETFGECATDFAKYEAEAKWDKWIEGFAWLIWQYRGGESNQSASQRNDDYMQAKRLLAYLIAEDLLARLTVEPTQCPLTLLTPAHVRYLLSLSVEEYATTKAFFAYIERERSGKESNGSSHQSDFAVALQDLNAKLNGLLGLAKRQACSNCRGQLRILHEAHVSGSTYLERIQSAKLYVLGRLGRVDLEVRALMNECAESLHGWLRADGNLQVEAPTKPAEILSQHLVVVNIFEFLVMCVLAKHCHSDLSHFFGAGLGQLSTPDASTASC